MLKLSKLLKNLRSWDIRPQEPMLNVYLNHLQTAEDNNDLKLTKSLILQYLSIHPENYLLLEKFVYISRKITFNEQYKIKVFTRAINVYPNNTLFLNSLATQYYETGNFSKAIPLFEQILVSDENNHTVRYYHAIASKAHIANAPSPYLIELFDNFANYFEEKLLYKLQYIAPSFTISKLLPYLNNKHKHFLDLGCGTGLVGHELKKSIAYPITLDGVDLSTNMLEFAQDKKIYTNLYNKNIIDFLSTTEIYYDVILAIDVLIYLGDLTKYMELLFKCIHRHSIIAFTIESYHKDLYLDKSGRFKHSIKYINNLLMKNNAKILKQYKFNIRNENGKPVSAQLIICCPI